MTPSFTTRSRSRSLSSSSFSTSTSTSTTSSTHDTHTSHHNHSHRVSRAPSTQKLRLSRWLSSRLSSHHTSTISNDNNNNTTITPNNIHKSSIPETEIDSPRSSETRHNNNPYLDFSFEFGQDQGQGRAYHRASTPSASRPGLENPNEDDLNLSDSYAAYCREFTSSPVPGALHFHRNPTPLPRLPESTFYEEYPEQNPAAHLNPTPAGSGPGIRFLPVGAHGYDPASCTLPRPPPTPPPGILTPARYDEFQRQQEQDKEEKDKKTRWTWCLPIRMSWLPWGRARER
ncbi:hypothetical protein BJX99DRAFT_260174 [Aspergillus californicus]